MSTLSTIKGVDVEMLDCAIIGGGPAGLNAALVLGRSRRSAILFDNNKARNSVTQESHGFLTRDGIKPSELRAIAQQDLVKYPSITVQQTTIVQVTKQLDGTFELETEQGDKVFARKIIIATGLREILPDIERLRDFYGKSLFNCPYCDGWEIRDQPLVVISEIPAHAYHLTTMAYNWSKDLVLCTNGAEVLTEEQQQNLRNKGIVVFEQKIQSLQGQDGHLDTIVFEDGTEVARTAGFVTSHLRQATNIAESLGCEFNEPGFIVVDVLGKTNVNGVFAAGDDSGFAPPQLINAAASGSRAAMGVNAEIIAEDF